jgi:hypothetical protein
MNPTKKIIEQHFSSIAWWTSHSGNNPHVVTEVSEIVNDTFVIAGLENDDWIAAYRVIASYEKGKPHQAGIYANVMLELERLAIEYLLHRNVLILVEEREDASSASHPKS